MTTLNLLTTYNRANGRWARSVSNIRATDEVHCCRATCVVSSSLSRHAQELFDLGILGTAKHQSQVVCLALTAGTRQTPRRRVSLTTECRSRGSSRRSPIQRRPNGSFGDGKVAPSASTV